jgi:lysozyme family protein
VAQSDITAALYRGVIYNGYLYAMRGYLHTMRGYLYTMRSHLYTMPSYLYTMQGHSYTLCKAGTAQGLALSPALLKA